MNEPSPSTTQVGVSNAPNPRWNAIKGVTRFMACIVKNKEAFLNRDIDSSRRQKDSGDTPPVQCWTKIACDFNDPTVLVSVYPDPDGRDLGMSAERTSHQTTSDEL